MSENTFEHQNESTEPPDVNPAPDLWYYNVRGARKGPVPPLIIKAMLDKQEIDAETPVWRKGLPDWQTIRESDLNHFVGSQPPAVPPANIGNGYVWALAFLPLITSMLEALFAPQSRMTPMSSKTLEFHDWLFIGTTSVLGWLDAQRLKEAGHGTWKLQPLAILVLPIYLFVRAKRLKQWPTYAVTWIAAVLFGSIV